ncbi:MAG: aspartate aminotransferase family protein [Pirellula sp.]|nr:aspartate aminotransferase family protein [Pirellula sp.]
MSSAVDRSLSVFPAGCNGEFNLPPRLAKVIARGEGPQLWTSDGERMIDFSMGWGSVLPGHAHPAIVEAVSQQVARGSNFAYVTEASLALAEEIVSMSPACDQVRFSASGTEATMYCLRLTRAFTGRPKILKFEGAYHGAHDVGVVSLFPNNPPDFPECLSSSAGIEPGAAVNTLVAPFNDLETVQQILQRHGHEIAGVIVEPFQRCLSPLPGFLAGLKKAVHEAGALLIFDEVVTGFRLAYGGAQEYYGVIPDLVAYGKALGGGMPIGAYGGRRDVMEQVCEDRLGDPGYVWTASTLGGNPVSTAAASAALSLYREEGVYARLHRLGAYLRRSLASILAERDVTAQILGDGPIAQVAFTEATPRDYRSSRHADGRLARRLMLELFSRGVFLNPMGTKLYLSLAHTEATCDEFCGTFADAFDAVYRASESTHAMSS